MAIIGSTRMTEPTPQWYVAEVGPYEKDQGPGVWIKVQSMTYAENVDVPKQGTVLTYAEKEDS